MSLPHNLFAVAFRQQHLGAMFAAVLAMAVYVASIALVASAALSNATTVIERNIGGRATVEIPASSENLAASALTALQAMPELSKAERVSDDETASVLKPWISDGAALRALPLPILIDIESADGQRLDSEAIKGKLSSIVPDARVDSHADWMTRLLMVVRSLSAVALLVIAITFVTLGISISLSCRAAMAVQRDTIELLHIMGAKDRDIAAHFQLHVLRLSWPAALAGFALAIGTSVLVAFLAANFIDKPFPVPSLEWLAPALEVIAVPLAATLGAAAAARIFVLKSLRLMP